MGGYRGETRELVRLEFLSGNNGICITFKRMLTPAEGSIDAWRLFQNVVIKSVTIVTLLSGRLVRRFLSPLGLGRTGSYYSGHTGF